MIIKKIRLKILKLLSMFGPEGSRAKKILKYHILQGMIIGDNTHVYSTVLIGEPYLVSIGSNSTISANVCFLTHDASIGAIGDRNNRSDLCGYIKIGNNCFVGYGSIIMYGVSLADNIIVAAGTVVTKSFYQQNVVIGGNPAKIICTVNDFLNKREYNAFSLHGKSFDERKKIILQNRDMLVTK